MLILWNLNILIELLDCIIFQLIIIEEWEHLSCNLYHNVFILVKPFSWRNKWYNTWISSLFIYPTEQPGFTSISPIRRGFASGFVNYKKGVLDSQEIKFTSCLTMAGGSPAASTTKTGRHDIAKILLKVALSTKKSKPNHRSVRYSCPNFLPTPSNMFCCHDIDD